MIVALVVFAAGAFGLRSWNRAEPVTTPADPWAWATEGWTELPAPPEWRDGASIVWTGSQLVYWGGTPRGSDGPPKADGYVFDPGSREWSAMPPADLPGTNAKAVWTGSMALFWDFSKESYGYGMQGYEPFTRTWYRFESPLLHDPAWGGTYAWTGTQLVVFGGGPKGSSENVQGAAFDPHTGGWHRIADAPLGLNMASSVWTGTSLLVVGSLMDDGRHATTQTSVAMRYEPSTDSWTRLPDPPVSPQTADVTSVGGSLVTWEDYTPAGAVLTDAGAWRPIDTGDLTASECYAQGAAAGDALLAWNCGRPAAWFASTRTWTGLPRPIQPSAPALRYDLGWTYNVGSAAVVDQIESVDDHGTYVGSPDAPEHLWLWRPPRT